MNAPKLKLLVAAVLVAGSLAAISARADGLHAGGNLGTARYQDSVHLDAAGHEPLSQEETLFGHIGVAHANPDTSSGDGSDNELELELAPHNSLTDHVWLGGEWEPSPPGPPGAFVFGDRPEVYTFGLHIAF